MSKFFSIFALSGVSLTAIIALVLALLGHFGLFAVALCIFFGQLFSGFLYWRLRLKQRGVRREIESSFRAQNARLSEIRLEIDHAKQGIRNEAKRTRQHVHLKTSPIRSQIKTLNKPESKSPVKAASTELVAETYRRKLWGGFSERAHGELTRVANNIDLNGRERGQAHYYLAQWQAVAGDYELAHWHMRERSRLHPAAVGTKRQGLVEAYFLARLGRVNEASGLLESFYRNGSTDDASVRVGMVNTYTASSLGDAGEAEVLRLLGGIYEAHGLVGLEKCRQDKPLTLDNLRGKTIEHEHFVLDGPKVSVILPAYNAAEHISTALRSLADQTWRNLEVIVVDDVSEDGTFEVAAEFASKDVRFTVLKSEANQGSYAARNLALTRATGDYITVHDSDDWSHPQKIEMQMKHIAPCMDYNFSMWVRATPELFFTGTTRPESQFVLRNDSSALYSRDLIASLGGWDDRMRIAADVEFLWRAERLIAGSKRKYAKRKVLSDCPLAIGRFGDDSLTRKKATHVSTLWHGIRKEYRDAADWWHEEKMTGSLTMGDVEFTVPYLPANQRVARKEDPHYDILFIADYNMVGGTFKSGINMIKAAKFEGLKCAVMHYPRYDLDVTKPLNWQFRELAYSMGISIIAPGDIVEANTVIITHPPILNERMDRVAGLRPQRVVLVVNQMAERDVLGTDKAYSPQRVHQNMIDLFDVTPEWAPISGLVRRLMEEDSRYPKPHPQIWTPLIEPSIGDSTVLPVWRRNGNKRPVVGRHGRDHRLKWPGTAQVIREAYLVDKECDVVFLGGSRRAETVLGESPENWTSIGFGKRDVAEFLDSLDVFLHFPHEDYIEEFGRAPMEAMAHGVPVILPTRFKETFGEAALYASPEEVWSYVKRLWTDKSYWVSQVEKGIEFVEKECSYDSFRGRIVV